MGTTSLTRHAHLMRDPDPDGAFRRAREGWRNEGVIVLMPATIARLDWQDRELVEAIAKRTYGERP